MLRWLQCLTRHRCRCRRRCRRQRGVTLSAIWHEKQEDGTVKKEVPDQQNKKKVYPSQ